MKLAVFPNDDLAAYIRKGETRKGYFNPNNLFNHIYIFNPSAKQPLDHATVQYMCGTAHYTIIFTGAMHPLARLLLRNKTAERCLNELRKIQPDAIRSYGMLFNSYYAAYCAKKTHIPFILSLHDNYNDVRYIARKSGRTLNMLFYSYWKHHEKAMLRQADRIIAVYGYAKRYALDCGIAEQKITVLYNRISKDFTYKRIRKHKQFTIINVMRQDWEKNQEVLIRAIAMQPQTRLVLIGSGAYHERLRKLAEELGCAARIDFLSRVPNKQLPRYYQQAHVFASSIRQGGVGIPDLEAFCCGLPVVHAIYWDEDKPDLLHEYAMRIPNTPAAFAQAFQRLQTRTVYQKYQRNSFKARRLLRDMDMDAQEESLYRKVLAHA